MYNLIFVVGALVVLAIVMLVFWIVDFESPLRAVSREANQKLHEMYNRPSLKEQQMHLEIMKNIMDGHKTGLKKESK